jgi:RNA polymerase sigma factor (sigma-70 family)
VLVKDNLLVNEKELLEKVTKSDEASFAFLVRKYHAPVYQAGLRLTGAPELAEEIVQDVFLKIWLYRSRLPDIENFQAYLYIIARNQAYQTHRKQLRHEQMPDEEPVSLHISDVEERLAALELSRILAEAVDRLPPQQRQVYQLIKDQDMSREAAARVMSLSPESVKKYLARALLSIRAYCLSRIEDAPVVFILFYLIC